MKVMLTVFFLSVSFVAEAKSKYIFVCRSDKMELSLSRNLILRKQINGWQQFWGTVDYKVNNISGSIDAAISWRKDPRPGFNALSVSLMEPEEVLMRKSGIEGGAVGFGGIDSRDNIVGTFKANWMPYRFPQKLKLFPMEEVPMTCQMD